MEALWGLKKILSRAYPVTNVAVTHAIRQILPDVKDVLQKETLARLMLRVQGNIVIAGAGPGAATGRENPEALVTLITGNTVPGLGLLRQKNLSARGTVLQGVFDRGYGIRATDVADAAGTIAVDFVLPLFYKQPGAVNPVEWALPMALFEQYPLQLSFGGRDQLFTGGTNTWDLSGLTVELWADFDDGVAGKYHAVEEFEQTFPITATQADFQIILEKGYVYTHLLFFAERDNVLDNALINSITVQSAGRIWTPQGDQNAAIIQRWNRETHVNNAAEALTGMFFIPMLRDGMYTRAVDALTSKLEIKLDVTLGGGTVRQVTVRGRRILPLALSVAERKAA